MTSLTLPKTLSPSKVSGFKDCAMQFRFQAIDGLRDPPTVHTEKGTVVHRALELFYRDNPQGKRTLAAAMDCLRVALREFADSPESVSLALPPLDYETFVQDATDCVENLFKLEDPNEVSVVSTEVRMDALLDGVRLRGIIDRLDDEDGELVVVDYKTGKIPDARYEQGKLDGVHFYAYLLDSVFGRRPLKVRLVYLKSPDPIVIEASPSGQSVRGHRKKLGAVWTAIRDACEDDSFEPRPSGLCGWCNFKPYCPAFGGNPSEAKAAFA